MANELLNWIMHASVLLTAVTLAILLLRRFMLRFFGAGIAYQYWLILPVALLASLLPHSASIEPIPQAAQPIAQLLNYATPIAQSSSTMLPECVVTLWILGCLMVAAWFWRQHIHYLRMLGNLKPMRGIYLAESLDAGPALIGVWRARIIVPADFFQRYTVEEQELIIAHEKSHARRGDAYANMLCAFAQCLFWFNPLLHLAANYFRLDQELACDASVMVQHPNARRAYAEAMLKTLSTESRSVIGCQLQYHQPLKDRIMQLHQASPAAAKKSLGKFILTAFMGLCAYSAWAASPATVQDAVSAKEPTPAQSQATISGKKTYSVKTRIQLDGVSVNPRTHSKEGEAAHISVDGKSAKWDIAYTLHAAKAKDGAEAVMLDMAVKKDGKIVAQPKLLVGLNMPATVQRKNSADGGDFDISLEPGLID
ncbi:MAG: hypothetical protein HYZ65_05165 [Burkholderiales bacterium]|nr:hypothetical protein [Burkholderiales bacterium]